jgi:predicted RNase H-like nuclease
MSAVYKVGIDDVLDAFALALTACAPHDEFQRLPSDPPEDTRGLPMQMVYRSETQLR